MEKKIEQKIKLAYADNVRALSKSIQSVTEGMNEKGFELTDIDSQFDRENKTMPAFAILVYTKKQ